MGGERSHSSPIPVPSVMRSLSQKIQMPLSRGNLVSQYDIFFFQTLYYHKLRLGRTGNAIADCFHSFFEFSQTFTQMDCAVPRKYKICKTTLHENHRFAFGSACWISSKLSEQLGIGNWSIRETIRD